MRAFGFSSKARGSVGDSWCGRRGRQLSSGWVVSFVAVAAALLTCPAQAQPGTTERVSVSSSGEQGNLGSYTRSIGADGRFVAFDSYASNLVPGDTNGREDAFVRDRLTGTTERISLSSSGAQGNNGSGSSHISADGRFVAFQSYASNLVPGDTNASADVFVRDRQLRTTERVSVSSFGEQGNDDSSWPSISADGRFVAFNSDAWDLVPDDTNDDRDVFVHDRLTATTERVSVASTGGQGNSYSGYWGPSISVDGRFVAFDSRATNLVPGDTNGYYDAFVRDRQLGTTELVSVSSSGEQGNGASAWPDGQWHPGPSVSADGRFVAFDSEASNLVPGDTSGYVDTFVRDRQLGMTERVSVSSSGEEGDGNSVAHSSISADGRFVAFPSLASNLVAGDTNGYRDVFVRDRQLGTTERVSVSTSGEQGNSNCEGSSALSADGRFVAFGSWASNLVPGDTNGCGDVFVHERPMPTTERVSVSSSGRQGNDWSGMYDRCMSDDGRYVAFTSRASDLVPGDTNGTWDVFVRDRQLGTTARVSLSSSGEQGNDESGQREWALMVNISADGRFVAFYSNATNLVPGDTNGFGDVFVRDRATATTERISLSSSGEEGNQLSLSPRISADGRFVAFQSYASNLVSGDSNNCSDVFVRDRQLGTTDRVSVSSSGDQGNRYSGIGSISADGRFVVFSGQATNLVDDDTNHCADVFVRDRQLGTTERVSVSSSGEQGNADCYYTSVSADGRFVEFCSYASNLVDGDTNGYLDIFVRDRQLGTTERVSVSSTGQQGNGASCWPSISADGRFVTFDSESSNLVSGDTNGRWDVFVRDRLLGTTERVSVSSSGEQGNRDSRVPCVSADARFVAFSSDASNLVPDDTNGTCDILLYDRETHWDYVFGIVTFQHLDPAATPPSSVSVRIRSHGALFASYDVDLSPNGAYALMLPGGPHTLSIKHTHWLRQTVLGDTSFGPAYNVDFSLLNGDAVYNNAVDIDDLVRVLVTYDKPSAMADLDQNGTVDLLDLNIVFSNFGCVGDQ
jgi:hypothetical protein